MIKSLKLMLAVSAAALAAGASPAIASPTALRAWVSGHGTDAAGCGTPAAPCRSLQYAHDNIVAAGGEIDILDPAGYGAITINKAISIVNDGVGTAGVQATTGNAITILAGATDIVRLRGLNVEGLGAGSNGIVFATGASLSIEDCSVDDFIVTGVFLIPSVPADFYVSNTRITNNRAFGLSFDPAISGGVALVHATFDNVTTINDGQAGVIVDGRNAPSSIKTYVTLSNSLAAENSMYGVHAVSSAGDSAPVFMVRNTSVSNNGTGVVVEANSTLFLAHSTLTGNAQALANTGGVLASYGDNNIDGNVLFGASPTSASLH